MVFNNKNGGKEKLAKLTQDLSDKYYNGEIDEKTFRENADFVIDNSADLDYAKAQIDKKLGEWKAKWQA